MEEFDKYFIIGMVSLYSFIGAMIFSKQDILIGVISCGTICILFLIILMIRLIKYDALQKDGE